jgi:hypothetical protein
MSSRVNIGESPLASRTIFIILYRESACNEDLQKQREPVETNPIDGLSEEGEEESGVHGAADDPGDVQIDRVYEQEVRRIFLLPFQLDDAGRHRNGGDHRSIVRVQLSQSIIMAPLNTD